MLCIAGAARPGVRAASAEAHRPRRAGCTTRSRPGSAGVLTGASAGALETAIVLVAAVKIVVSMAWFITIALQPTMGVAWHRFLAFPNIWFKRHPVRGPGRAPGQSLGALQPIRSTASRSTSRTSTSWTRTPRSASARWRTSPGRACSTSAPAPSAAAASSQCPAWNTDKPLSPKMLVLALRDHAHAKAPWLLAAGPRRSATPPAAGCDRPATAGDRRAGRRPSARWSAPVDAGRPAGRRRDRPGRAVVAASPAAPASSSARSTSSTSTTSSTCAATRC